jgi:hypothetical protein
MTPVCLSNRRQESATAWSATVHPPVVSRSKNTSRGGLSCNRCRTASGSGPSSSAAALAVRWPSTGLLLLLLLPGLCRTSAAGGADQTSRLAEARWVGSAAASGCKADA